MKKIVIALVSLAVLAVSCCRNSETAAVKPELIVISSENLHCDDSVLVFTPSCVKSDTIPAVIVLHGYSGCYRDWTDHMDLQALAEETGFRIICPDGFYKSWYVNSVDPAGMQWRTFFWEELYPELQKRYLMLPECTFVTGLSMGGHGAMNIFLDHPELFRGAGSMSGVLDLRCTGSSKTYIPELLGAKDIDAPEVAAQSAVNRLERVAEMCTAEDAAGKVLVITCGYEDKPFLPAATDFAARCKELGLRHILMLSPARHRWPYWCWVIRYHLDWFNQNMSEGTAAYGMCK